MLLKFNYEQSVDELDKSEDVVSSKHSKINSCFSLDTTGEQQTRHEQLIMTINNNRLDSQDLTTRQQEADF